MIAYLPQACRYPIPFTSICRLGRLSLASQHRAYQLYVCKRLTRGRPMVRLSRTPKSYASSILLDVCQWVAPRQSRKALAVPLTEGVYFSPSREHVPMRSLAWGCIVDPEGCTSASNAPSKKPCFNWLLGKAVEEAFTKEMRKKMAWRIGWK